MITRIVKMTFEQEKVPDFLAMFKDVNVKIRNFSGCEHLELWRDVKQPNIMFTYSKWDSDKSLQAYRKSELFAQTWKITKAMFAEKAEAWSVQRQEF